MHPHILKEKKLVNGCGGSGAFSLSCCLNMSLRLSNLCPIVWAVLVLNTNVCALVTKCDVMTMTDIGLILENSKEF